MDIIWSICLVLARCLFLSRTHYYPHLTPLTGACSRTIIIIIQDKQRVKGLAFYAVIYVLPINTYYLTRCVIKEKLYTNYVCSPPPLRRRRNGHFKIIILIRVDFLPVCKVAMSIAPNIHPYGVRIRARKICCSTRFVYLHIILV